MWWKILLLVLVVYCIYYYFYSSNKKVEQFTAEEQTFAEKLAAFFKATGKPTFNEYLTKIVELKNTSDNLISKGVHKKLLKKGNKITAKDVLAFMDDE